MKEPYPIAFTFHAMARSGNYAGLKTLLQQVGDEHAKNIINGQDHRGFTVLHKAMESGHLKLVQMLLDLGADIAAKVTGEDPKGWTALHLAAFDNHPKVIQLLVKAGAEINVRDQGVTKMTPLRVAVSRNHPKCLKELLTLGADPMEVDPFGFTLLHEAANMGSKEMVECLLAAGCDRSAKANDGSTPAMWAARQGNGELEALLNS